MTVESITLNDPSTGARASILLTSDLTVTSSSPIYKDAQST